MHAGTWAPQGLSPGGGQLHQFLPLCARMVRREAEGVGGLLSMAPSESLVPWAPFLRGFPDSGVCPDLLRRRDGVGGTEAASGRCPTPTAPDGRKKRQEAVLGPGDPRAGWSWGRRASRSPHKVCGSKC